MQGPVFSLYETLFHSYIFIYLLLVDFIAFSNFQHYLQLVLLAIHIITWINEQSIKILKSYKPGARIIEEDLWRSDTIAPKSNMSYLRGSCNPHPRNFTGFILHVITMCASIPSILTNTTPRYWLIVVAPNARLISIHLFPNPKTLFKSPFCSGFLYATCCREQSSPIIVWLVHFVSTTSSLTLLC